MDTQAGPPKKTPLNGLFREMGARLVDFAGWEMPVHFSSILEEHHAVRGAAGIFDVSHMGEIHVGGGGALLLIQGLTCNDAARLQTGQAHYTALTTEKGTFVDDILVYRRGRDDFFLVVNAGNTDKDFAWIARHAEKDVEVVNASARWAQLALQGPKAETILASLTPLPLRSMRYYHFLEGEVRGVPSIVSRTGYTGEDGFEIYLPPGAAADVYRAILDAGRAHGIRPCGLGARDTLRLEARMALYGNDIDETTTVFEAGLEWIVRLEKGDFIGRGPLAREQETGPKRRLVGFEMLDPGIARHGYPVFEGGREVGTVTSGTLGPTVKKNIGLAYVPTALSAAGTRLSIGIRGRQAAVVVVPTPFYKRQR